MPNHTVSSKPGTRTTVRDVAALAGVHHASVSVALNSAKSGTGLSQVTRDRIIEAARQLNYRPNPAARSLQRRRSNCVAFVHTKSARAPLGSMTGKEIGIAADRLGLAGFETKISVFADQPATLTGLRELRHSGAADMVILWSADYDDVREQADVAESVGLPFVAFGRFEVEHPEWLQVDFDHEGMTMQSVKRLWESGHRNIAYVGYDANLAHIRALLTGYIDAMESLTGQPANHRLIMKVANGTSTPQSVGQRIAEWMSMPTDVRPTAIVMSMSADIWSNVEIGLFKQGRFIGCGPSDIEVTGLCYYRGCLTFGNAVGYAHFLGWSTSSSLG